MKLELKIIEFRNDEKSKIVRTFSKLLRHSTAEEFLFLFYSLCLIILLLDRTHVILPLPFSNFFSLFTLNILILFLDRIWNRILPLS